MSPPPDVNTVTDATATCSCGTAPNGSDLASGGQGVSQCERVHVGDVAKPGFGSTVTGYRFSEIPEGLRDIGPIGSSDVMSALRPCLAEAPPPFCRRAAGGVPTPTRTAQSCAVDRRPDPQDPPVDDLDAVPLPVAGVFWSHRDRIRVGLVIPTRRTGRAAGGLAVTYNHDYEPVRGIWPDEGAAQRGLLSRDQRPLPRAHQEIASRWSQLGRHGRRRSQSPFGGPGVRHRAHIGRRVRGR